jgi:hypothetical protein
MISGLYLQFIVCLYYRCITYECRIFSLNTPKVVPMAMAVSSGWAQGKSILVTTGIICNPDIRIFVTLFKCFLSKCY